MPTLETDRLKLRMFTRADLDDLAILIADPDVIRYVGSGKPGTREEAVAALQSVFEHWETHGFGRWAVVDKQTGTFIGLGGLRTLQGTPEVVYHLAKAYWGRGLATELARASLRYGFEEHKFDRVVAIAKPANLASIRVMEKVGMHYEMQTNYYNLDVVQYAIAREEFDSEGSTYLVSRG